MKVSELKQLIDKIPDDYEVMICSRQCGVTLPVNTTGSGTVQVLSDTGKTFLGMPVVGGPEVSAIILYA